MPCSRLSKSLLRITGAQHLNWLQSIITTNILNNQPNKLHYTLMLNNSGRILFDSMIYNIDKNETLLDTDDCDNLYAYLHSLLFRQKVKIEKCRDKQVNWSNLAFESNDPRSSEMGRRFLTQLEKTTKTKNEEYEAALIKNVLAEGKLIQGRLPHLFNFDLIPNVMGCDKGCYTGQEYVMRLRSKNNQVKRRLFAFDNVPLDNDSKLYSKDNCKVGMIIKQKGPIAIGIMDACFSDNVYCQEKSLIIIRSKWMNL